MSAAEPAAASLGHAAYLSLRDELLSGRIPPGRKLKIADLAAALDTNATGIREALTRLAAEGLATAEPQKGFRAAELSPFELRDLTEVRIHLEILCLRQAMEAGDLAWEAGIAAARYQLARVSAVDPKADPVFGTRWAAAHWAFHASLVAACPSVWSLRLREQLWWQSERYRQASIAAAGSERDIQAEHEALADATLGRELPRVEQLMTEHLERTAADLLPRIDFGHSS